MMTAVVLTRQTWLDIALVMTGDADMAYEIAKENGMAVSDTPPVGMEIQYSGGVVNRQVFDYYSKRGIRPATAVAEAEAEAEKFKIFDYTFDYTFE